jgi:methyl-accepting chemotaxis protein
MNFLSSLNIGKRLALAFVVVLALTLTLGAVAILSIGKVNSSTEEIATNWLPATVSLGEYRSALNRMRRAQSNYMIANKPEKRASALKMVAEAQTSIAENWRDYETTIESDAERKLAAAVSDKQRLFVAAHEKFLAAPRASEADEDALEAMYEGPGLAAINELFTALTVLQEYQKKGAAAAHALSKSEYKSAVALVAGLLVAAVLTGSILSWMISRSITIPVAQAVKIAQTVASGDLTSRIETKSRDEIGQLLRALGDMNTKLVDIVGSVRNSSDSFATGSSQIATGNADLSQRTEEQASNLQQTAASMEQLTATVKQNADTARQATQLAAQASDAAAHGGQVVEQVVVTMGTIADSSKRIVDIISVIDGIAFQTNILALNAAVEAARAGEQGRGFAVVAGEVRALAQRSANAAREIKTLITQSVDKVEAGSRLVDEAGQSMSTIVAQVKRVSDLIGEISAASIEQTQGIGQIGDAVSQLDQVTQQNAALVEESAAAAESLRVQAAQLAELVGQFRLDGREKGHHHAAAPAVAAARPAPPARVAKAASAAKPQAASATAGTAHARAAAPLAAPQPRLQATGDAGDWETF